MSKSRSGYAKRRASRLAAVQALYQMELSGARADDAIADQALREPDPETEGKKRAPIDQEFFGDLVRGVRDRRDDIDRMIDGALAEGWAIARLDAVLRATLRAGVCELLTQPRDRWAGDHQRICRDREELLRRQRAEDNQRRAGQAGEGLARRRRGKGGAEDGGDAEKGGDAGPDGVSSSASRNSSRR